MDLGFFSIRKKNMFYSEEIGAMLQHLRVLDKVWLVDLGQKTIPADFLFFFACKTSPIMKPTKKEIK